MNPQEHIIKEIAKRMADSNPNYTDKTKIELKAIIDASNTPMQAVEAILAYFSILG